MIYQHLAHDARGQREKVPLIGDPVRRIFRQAKVSLVDERGCLERVVLSLVAQPIMRQPSQLGIDKRNQRLERFLITAGPAIEKLVQATRIKILCCGHN